MISINQIKSYCLEDPSLIENYDKAIKDKTQTWECHHRLEIQNGNILSSKDLKNMNLYFRRPASELILLTKKDHMTLHGNNKLKDHKIKISKSMKGKPFSQSHKINMSNAQKGRKQSEETKLKLSNYWKGKKRGSYKKRLIDSIESKS